MGVMICPLVREQGMGITARNKRASPLLSSNVAPLSIRNGGATVAHKMKLRPTGRLMERDAKRRAGLDPPVFHT